MTVSQLAPELLPAHSRRNLLTLTLGLVLLSVLLRGVLLRSQPAPLSGGLDMPGLLWSLLSILALIVLARLRRLPLELTVMLGVLAFFPAALLDMLQALADQALPGGLGLWTPVVIVEAFLLLGSRLGLIVVGVIGAALLFGLTVRFPTQPGLQLAWLNLVLVSLLLAALSFGASLLLERSRDVQARQRLALAESRLDALTRVLGRAGLEDELQRRVARAEAGNTALSLVVCDIDNFKEVNDNHGHARGDEVIRAVAQKLRRSASNGVVGRWGGEEFLMVLPLPRPDALALAEQLRRDIEQSELAGLHVTASFGVASYRAGESHNSVFARADQQLYEAKRAGRNAVR